MQQSAVGSCLTPQLKHHRFCYTRSASNPDQDSMYSTRIWLSLFLLLVHRTLAQSDCSGPTIYYNESSLTIPFKNLCGKDISAGYDFPDPSIEPSRAYCLMRCVQKAPLCYGFDFRTPDGTGPNCYLMQAKFSESSAVYIGVNFSAGMLDAGVADGLAADCYKLGLFGCWKKNGQISESGGTSTSSVMVSTRISMSLTATTSSVTGSSSNTASTSLPPLPSGGLSTGAKAGIGAGVGAAALLVIIGLVVFILMRRKRNTQPVFDAAPPCTSDKNHGYAHHGGTTELSADQTEGRGELESPPPQQFDASHYIGLYATKQPAGPSTHRDTAGQY
jgi:hypothetical protein